MSDFRDALKPRHKKGRPRLDPDAVLTEAERAARYRTKHRDKINSKRRRLTKQKRRAPNGQGAEWYTPARYLEPVRAVLGSIDCDPASSETAQATVGAGCYYTADNDGLSKPWIGTVFLNPPYDLGRVTQFVDKLIAEYGAGRTTAAIVLVNAQTSAEWFSRLLSVAAAVCYPDHRIRFLDAEGRPGSPKVGQAFLYFGPVPERFHAVFAPLGHVTGTRLP
jgi:ParB family chromosome partitioning protein